ncbi:hypothetical protein [Sorlinia euscelidii]
MTARVIGALWHDITLTCDVEIVQQIDWGYRDDWGNNMHLRAC